MGVRKDAKAVGAAHGLGRYECLARPGLDGRMLPLAFGALTAVPVATEHDGSAVVWICSAVAAGWIGLYGFLRYKGRAGANVPHLYCFTHGVVHTHNGTSTPYRWTEVGTGSSTTVTEETAQTTTHIFLTSDDDYRCLATFTGEPRRAHLARLMDLHTAALDALGRDATPPKSGPP
ncbi:hypothetical protein ACFZBU_10670 [Embleya sp. NPDC008237]|uniref:hypothetical protein n=1 Tax=Embleya sp. NPDC008237 TaxID=3363978 RepID=UPI0036EFC48E